MNQKKMHQSKKLRGCGNFQQYLKPSEAFKSILLHGRNVTKQQVENGKVVAKNTQGGWSKSEYWMDYVMVNGEVFLNDKLPKFVAESMESFKDLVKTGRLKFVKLLEE